MAYATLDTPALLTELNDVVKTNGNEEINAENLNQLMGDMITSLANKITNAASLGINEYDPSRTYPAGAGAFYQGRFIKAKVQTSGTFAAGDWLDVLRKNSLMLFVNPEQGDDATGKRGYAHLPYATPAAAQAAASAGDTIFVLPGDYTVSGLGKDGVNWFLMQGAAFYANSGNNIFTDGGSPKTFSVFGYGKFYAGTQVLNGSNINTVLYLEGNYASNTNYDTGMFKTTNGAKITVVIRGDAYADRGTILETRSSASTNLTDEYANVNIWGKATSKEIAIQVLSAHNYGIVRFTVGKGLFLPADTNDAYAGILQECGTLIFTGDITQLAPNPFYIGMVVWITNSWAKKTVINGNVTANLASDVNGNQVILIQSGALSGHELIVNGNINAVGNFGGYFIDAVIANNSANSTIILNGDVTTNSPSIPSVTQVAGKVILKGKLKNLDSTGFGVLVTTDDGLELTPTARIVVDPSVSSVYAGSPKTIKSYPGCTANKAVDPNITEKISTILVDADVD